MFEAIKNLFFKKPVKQHVLYTDSKIKIYNPDGSTNVKLLLEYLKNG